MGVTAEEPTLQVETLTTGQNRAARFPKFALGFSERHHAWIKGCPRRMRRLPFGLRELLIPHFPSPGKDVVDNATEIDNMPPPSKRCQRQKESHTHTVHDHEGPRN